MLVNNLFEDATFKEKFLQAESKDDLQKLFGEYGVELSREEVDEFVAELEAFNAGDELSEETLEDVSGGGITMKKLAGWCVAAFKKGWEYGKKFFDWEQSLYK